MGQEQIDTGVVDTTPAPAQVPADRNRDERIREMASMAHVDMTSRALGAYVSAYLAHVGAGAHPARAIVDAKAFAMTLGDTAAEIAVRMSPLYMHGKLNEETTAALHEAALKLARQE